MTDAPKTPSHFYIWRNEPNGEWVVSEPETPYPADAIRAIPLPADDAEMVERVARALLVSEPEAYANSQELLDEHFEWWRAGRDDPESCVHYSSIGIAIRQARAALSAMRGKP